jgi:hypothetical protein
MEKERKKERKKGILDGENTVVIGSSKNIKAQFRS